MLIRGFYLVSLLVVCLGISFDMPVLDFGDAELDRQAFASVASRPVLRISKSQHAEIGSVKPNSSGCKAKHYELPINTYSEPEITKTMDLNIGKYAAGHRGVDLNAVDGAEIIAPDNGEITWKGVAFGVPTITYTINGLKNSFQPAMTVLKKGTKLAKGEVLGVVVLGKSEPDDDSLRHCEECYDGAIQLSSNTGLPRSDELATTDTGITHDYSLHWGISPADNEYLNPLAFVYRKRVVLY